MNVVYLVFGNQIEVHQQANFSILTLLANGGDCFDNIIVITDAPEYYQNISSNKFAIELICSETINQWKGNSNYELRVKIKALEFIIDKYNTTDVLFLNSNTFIKASLKSIKDHLQNGCFMLHLNEGRLSESTRRTQKRIWKTIKRKTILEYKIPHNLCMWNSGVIGIPSQHNKLYIQKVLSFCDALYPTLMKHRLMEQLAFSLVLQQQSKFKETEKEIGHYWGNKEEWNTKITTLLLKNYFKNLNFKEQINSISLMDLQETPVIVKKSNTAKRLKRLIDKLF